MPLIVIGINHQTAPVSVRERVAFDPDGCARALSNLIAAKIADEAVIISTCNRMEIYCDQALTDAEAIVSWLANYHQLDHTEIRPYVYTHNDEAVVQHLLKVASGLDSMVLGEPQILGQIKSAYQISVQSQSLGSILERLFQHSFSAAKQVRTDTAIGNNAVSVASAAVSLARQIFGDLSRKSALLVGAGDTIELAARHLDQHGLTKMIIANRTLSRAQDLAHQFHAYAISLEHIASHLAEVDIVISSTGAPGTIIDRAMVEQALKGQKRRAIFMVDLAVPRDIDASIGDMEDLYLYTVDDLGGIIQDNLQQRKAAAEDATQIIDISVAHFMAWNRSLNAVPSIRALRTAAEQDRDEIVSKAMKLLRSGEDPEDVMQRMAHALTNKLIHRPSLHLRKAGESGRTELIDAARELFDLDDKKK